MLGPLPRIRWNPSQAPSPYSGAKILAGASAGEILFYDPDDTLDPAQYKGSVVHPIDDKKWKEVMERLMRLEGMFALGFSRENNHLTVRINGRAETIAPDRFKWCCLRER